MFFQLSKTTLHYHKLFKDVSKDELLKQSKFQILFSRKEAKPCYLVLFVFTQATLAPCRRTFCIRAKCSSLITGSASTRKSSVEIQRYDTASVMKFMLSCFMAEVPCITWLCFLQISIPAVTVTFIKKAKTALLVPNALVIETTCDQVRKENHICYPFCHKHERDSKII